MTHRSRRALLAAAGGVLAGCSAGRDRPTVTPYDVTVTDSDRGVSIEGPAPLGTRLVPPEAESLGDPEYELVLDTTPSWIPIDVLARETGVALLANTRTTAGISSPVRVTIDRDDGVTNRAALAGLPSERIWLASGTAAGHVVGGYTESPVRTWLQGYRGRTASFEHRTPAGVARQYRSLARYDGDIVAAGSAPDPDTAAVVRIGTDGAVRWTRTDATGAPLSLRAVAGTDEAILAGGARDSTAWLLSLDGDGEVIQSGPLLGSDRSYAVRDLATGPSGAYALVAPQSPDAGVDHLVLVALDDERVRWVRFFDPRGAESELGGGTVVDLNGPSVVGYAPFENAAWIASLAPDGTAERAGYYRFDDNRTRPIGLTATDEGLLAYGIVSSEHMAERSNAWLAWL